MLKHLQMSDDGLRSNLETRLTSLTHGGGCACKLSAEELTSALAPALSHASYSHPNLVVGVATSDDAGVWLLGDGLALIQTVDFFTPVLDDPYDWGRVAAANALSDVYAMGGKPATALQLLGWPRALLDAGLVEQVVEGGADVMAEAGCVIVGGHSIDSPEPTYGFAVTGTALPDRVVTNGGAKPGDSIILTKPLGVGIVTAALKREIANPAMVVSVVETMTTLNSTASSVMTEVGVHAATDVTGFGLLGHLHEVCRASGVGATVTLGSVPVLEGALDLAGEGVFSGGSGRNLKAAEGYTDFGAASDVWRMVLADAQTSGGLLIFVPPERAEMLMSALAVAGVVSASRIGVVNDGHQGIVVA